VISGFFVFLLNGSSSASIGLNSARSVGMGGAYNALARGVEAHSWNPANLGLDYFQNRWSVTLFNVGMLAFNDTYAKYHYDQYNGQDITNEKQNILDAIKGDAINLGVEAEIDLLCVAYRAFSFHIQALTSSRAAIAKALIELPLLGNTRDYNFTPLKGDGVFFWKVGYSGAFPLKIKWFRKATVGATFNYLIGRNAAQVLQSSGNFDTAEFLRAAGDVKMRESTGGNGFSFDIGFSAVTKRAWYISASVQNVVSHLGWKKDVYEYHHAFNLKNVNLDSLISAGSIDDFYETTQIRLTSIIFPPGYRKYFGLGWQNVIIGQLSQLIMNRGFGICPVLH
jgi:hypothetical protein